MSPCPHAHEQGHYRIVPDNEAMNNSRASTPANLGITDTKPRLFKLNSQPRAQGFFKKAFIRPTSLF